MNLPRWWIVAAVLAGATHARAQPAADADKLFDKGKQLMAANKLAEACTAFEDSQRLAPAITTAMNLANCREKNEQLATAHELFMTVAKELEGKPESKKLREVALQRAALLQGRLSKIVLVVPTASQVPGLEIQLDARSLPAAQWNQPITLDGGSYTLVARATDRTEWTTTVALAPSGDTKTVEVPVLADTKAAPTPTPVATTQQGSRKLPIAFGIAAIGLGATALGLELWGRSLYQQSKDELFDETRKRDLYDSANARHIPAQIAGIAALGCAAAAVVFYVTRDKPRESQTSVAIAPVASPTNLGLAAFATW